MLWSCLFHFSSICLSISPFGFLSLHGSNPQIFNSLIEPHLCCFNSSSNFFFYVGPTFKAIWEISPQINLQQIPLYFHACILLWSCPSPIFFFFPNRRRAIVNCETVRLSHNEQYIFRGHNAQKLFPPHRSFIDDQIGK